MSLKLTAAELSKSELEETIRELSSWYERQARALPWRQTNDPYAIWISEVMLQQTQVATVIPYYEKFISRFPTVDVLACSEESDVLSHWSGLGYYSRAKNLRRGAQHIRDEHRGRFPKTRDLALGVPGIGPYTAGAVLSIAYDLPVAIVDGNVKRVMARFFALDLAIDAPAAEQFFWERADAWVALCRSPRIFNQALMELGATICAKSKPQCHRCPIAGHCAAFTQNRQDELPKRTPRRKTIELVWSALVIESKRGVWMEQNPSGEWWADLWDFPHREAPSLKQAAMAFKEVGRSVPLPTQTHRVTHHKITLKPFWIWEMDRKFTRGRKGRWWTRAELSAAPISSLAAKVLSALPDRQATRRCQENRLD